MAIDTKELRTRAEDNIAQGMGHWAFAKSTDVLRLLDALDAQTAELEALKKATEELRQGDGRYYLTQEAAFAPGIVTDWPKVIPHPTDRNGRLVLREFPIRETGR